MTNSEYEILNYIKLNKDVSKFHILEKFHPDKTEDTFVLADARITALINSGMISSDNDHLSITPAGLHELDTYLDDQLRFERIDQRSEEANKLAAEANEIANKANDQSEEANKIAYEANAHSNRANLISVLSVIVAALALVISFVNSCKTPIW